MWIVCSPAATDSAEGGRAEPPPGMMRMSAAVPSAPRTGADRPGSSEERHHRARAVAEQHARRPVREVHDAREHLRADATTVSQRPLDERGRRSAARRRSRRGPRSRRRTGPGSPACAGPTRRRGDRRVGRERGADDQVDLLRLGHPPRRALGGQPRPRGPSGPPSAAKGRAACRSDGGSSSLVSSRCSNSAFGTRSGSRGADPGR